MTRTVGSNGPATADAIRKAGLRLIHERGYEGMSLRLLAAEVGLQPASLYHHFATKQALLTGLIKDHMETLLRETDAALPAKDTDALDRLRGFIRHHLTYHVERQIEVFIGNSELRSLEPENRCMIVDLRRAYEQRLIAILVAGQDEGVLKVTDVQTAAFAILAMLTGICTWYQPDGRLSVAELIEVHTDLVLSGCRRPNRARTARPSGQAA